MGKWQKRLLGVAAVLMLALGCTGLLYPWPDLPKAERLPPLYPPLPKSEIKPDNAAYYLMQLKPVQIVPVAERGKAKTGAYSNETSRFSRCGWKAGTYPDIEAAADDFKPNLQLLRQAAAAPEARMPRQESAKDVWQVPLSAYKGVVEHICFLAEAAAAQGRWDDAAALFRLGLVSSRTQSRGGLLMDRLCADACDALVLSSLRRTALERTPPPEWLRKWIAELAKKDAEAVPMSDTLRNEIEWGHRTMQTFCDGIWERPQKPIPENFLDWLDCFPEDTERGYRIVRRLRSLRLLWLFGSTEARTRRHCREIIDSLPQDVSGCWRELSQEQPAPATPLLRWFNDPVGRLTVNMAHILPSAFATSYRRFLHHQTTLRATEQLLALRLYQLEHDGRPPAALKELVAAGCPARLPDDPFALSPGTAFGYRVNADGSFVLWSCGWDGRDDGGAYDPANPSPVRLDAVKDIVFSSTQPADRRAKWLKEHPTTSAP